jgi:hypothetical protein
MKIKSSAGVLALFVILTTGFGGCAQKPKPPPATSNRPGVFTEVGNSSRPAEGMVDLTVKASVKTPTAEHYLLESRPVPPGGGFPFELNVDGQEVIWKVEGTRENTPVYGSSGRLPEGGEGIRYVLEKTIRLPAGPHHVVFGVPYDDYYTEVKVSLQEDMGHTLQFEPVYAMGRRGYRTFFHGISRTMVYLDGVRIK